MTGHLFDGDAASFILHDCLLFLFPRPIRQLIPTQPQPKGRWSTGSPADAVADVCGLRCVEHPDDLQLDARRQHLEQPTSTTKQHGNLMDLQLIQRTRLERPLRHVRAMHHHVPVPGGGLRWAIALSIPSVTYVTNA